MERRGLRGIGPAVALAALVLIPLVIWTASSLSEEDSPLTVVSDSAGRGPPELVVSLPIELNTPETVGGGETVELACLNSSGRPEFRVEHPFPFTDTDDDAADPHVHQPVSGGLLRSVERCRLSPTSPPLEAPVEAAPIPQ